MGIFETYKAPGLHKLNELNSKSELKPTQKWF